MRIYLAGPMRGFPDWNQKAFSDAADLWRRQCHQVFSPWEIAAVMGYKLDHPCEPGHKDGKEHLRHVMMGDVTCICHCDALAVLDGWQGSRGATVEVALAQFLGLKIFDAMKVETLNIPMTPWGQLIAQNLLDPKFPFTR